MISQDLVDPGNGIAAKGQAVVVTTIQRLDQRRIIARYRNAPAVGQSHGKSPKAVHPKIPRRFFDALPYIILNAGPGIQKLR
jgi:hypothetical protein